MRIKIYPSTGDCYYVELPLINPETQELYEWADDTVEDWIDTNLKHVELWEVM